MKPRGFPRQLRLRKRREFLTTQRRGRKIHTRHFLVFVLRTGALAGSFLKSKNSRRSRDTTEAAPARLEIIPSRVGITVTRKIGNAVTRNRIKRFVREAFRHRRDSFPPGFAMVWVAKRGAAAVQLADVLSAMETVSRQMRANSRGGRKRGR